MKTLFLDIDGVLNCTEGFEAGTCDSHAVFHPPTVDNLNVIIEAVPDVNIVISSTWRYIHKLDALKRIMLNNGVSVGGRGQRVVDVTPVLPSATRGHEIQKWMDDRSECDRGDNRFVIVDDDRDMEHLMPYLVHVNHAVGLTLEDAEKAVRILGGSV